MSSFVQRFSDGSIWGCLDDYFWHHDYGYVKLKNIEEWYNPSEDGIHDGRWESRIITEDAFREQTKWLTRVHEEPIVPESEKLITVAGAVAEAILEIKPVKPDAIIFDCDGVLLDCDIAPWHPKAVITPRENTIKLLRLLWRQSPRHPKIIILTGRPERIRHETSIQLLNNGIFSDELLMNNMSIGGKTASWLLFKIRTLPELMEKYNIIGMFEDDPAVIQSVRNIYPEIPTYHVYD